MTAEMPTVLRELGMVRFAQRGSRVIYRYDDKRDVRPELRKWMTEGMEFEDANVARTADYHHNRFGLHHFTSWEEGERWLAGDGRHEPWRDCPDCSEIQHLYDVWRAEDYMDEGLPIPEDLVLRLSASPSAYTEPKEGADDAS